MLPIPADTIIGLYHPFRDLYAVTNPNGIAYKNFLITDPIRQQFPWRWLSMDLLARDQLPLWNPYAFSGSPLLANIQNAALYPLNLLFLLIPFQYAWSIQVMLQPLFFGLFLYWYLRSLDIDSYASLLGSIVIAFCGFSVAWLEWNTVLQTGLWLPLILLGLDKVIGLVDSKHPTNKRQIYWWSFVLVFAICASFFAGHLQTYFYLLVITLCYFLVRFVSVQRKGTVVALFTLYVLIAGVVTAIGWYPAMQFIALSARNIDLDWHAAGWFLPWQHLIQFVVPDYFGNPTTLNYWGVWNYAEFIGYIGIIPLLLAIYAVITRRDKKTYLLLASLAVSLILALPTPLATLPFALQIPFVSTAQPTRLLYVIDVSLAILAALGFEHYLKKKKHMIIPIIIVGILFSLVWLGTLVFGQTIFHLASENIQTAKRNLYLPTVILLGGSILLLGIPKVQGKAKQIALIAIMALTVFDLFRFFAKFTPFTDANYLFPQTKVISFLQHHLGNSRIMETDTRLLPPNFTVMYKIQTVDGYDPLYLKRYGEFIAASERGKPDIAPPFGFNRIITPQKYNSVPMQLLNVKYILTMNDIQEAGLRKVVQEGQTRVYETMNSLPKVYFVKKVLMVANKKRAIEAIFSQEFLPVGSTAVIEKSDSATSVLFDNTSALADIVEYDANKVVVKTTNAQSGFLVLSDVYYPTWHALIDGKEANIYITDFTLRGIMVPPGKHTILFINRL